MAHCVTRFDTVDTTTLAVLTRFRIQNLRAEVVIDMVAEFFFSFQRIPEVLLRDSGELS